MASPSLQPPFVRAPPRTRAGTYSHWAYGVATSLSEVPFNTVLAILYFLLSYWTIGLNPSSDAAATYVLFLVSAYILLPSIGVLLCAPSAVVGLAPGSSWVGGQTSLMLPQSSTQ